MPYADKRKRSTAARLSDERQGRRTIRINADAETAAAFDAAVEHYGTKAAALRVLMIPWRA